MQELDEEIKLHNAGGDDAQDTSDVSAVFWMETDHSNTMYLLHSKIMHIFFAADQQLDGEDSGVGECVAVQEDGGSKEQRARSSIPM